MYRLSIEQEFDAAHFLRGYQGRCESLHGHRYKVVVTVQATKLNDIGIAYDFTDLKKALGEILGRFDHTCLNDVPPFDRINPSAENVAARVWEELVPKFKDAPAQLYEVEVWESPQSRAAYRPD